MDVLTLKGTEHNMTQSARSLARRSRMAIDPYSTPCVSQEIRLHVHISLVLVTKGSDVPPRTI